MRIALLEFVCGSGFFQSPGELPPTHARQKLPQSDSSSELLREGYAMLHALAIDLIACGHTVHTLIEPSIARWAKQVLGEDATYPPELCMSPIPIQHHPDLDCTLEAWLATAHRCDATIVIAPEIDLILAKLVTQLRSHGVEVIASSDEFIAVAADKWQTSTRWSQSGVPHPATLRLDAWLENSLRLHQPSGWVLKRRWGAGGLDMLRFRDAQSLREHCHRDVIPETLRADWVVQPWVEGIAASLAVVAHEQCHVLGAMQQHFGPASGTTESHAYAGGSGPLPSCTMDALQEFADRTLQVLPGRPRGWIGIDFVIEHATSWRAIEINARLTSSYLGYRQIFGPNVAQAMLDGETANCHRRLRESCCFSVADFRG